MTSPEAKNLEAISKAIDQHNRDCPFPAVAVEMNPFEVERLGWDSIRGLPIRANPELGTGAFRIVCAREEGEPGEVVEAVAEQELVAPPSRTAEPRANTVPPGRHGCRGVGSRAQGRAGIACPTGQI
jgi:hypothetical protein